MSVRRLRTGSRSSVGHSDVMGAGDNPVRGILVPRGADPSAAALADQRRVDNEFLIDNFSVLKMAPVRHKYL